MPADHLTRGQIKEGVWNISVFASRTKELNPWIKGEQTRPELEEARR
jgi:hypothetical protein